MKIKYCFLLSFFSLGLFGMESSTPKEKLAIEKKCCEGAAQQYNDAFIAYTADNTTPFIVYLIRNSPLFLWEALIRMGYRDKKITAADLQWVIREFSAPETLTSKNAEELFRVTILMHAKKAVAEEQDVLYTDEVEKLISKISFPEVLDYLAVGALYVNPAARNRIDSVLIDCIENKYYIAFEKILQAFTSFVTTAHEKKLVKREERGAVISEGWVRNNYEYKEQEYSLIEWLNRHDGQYLKKGPDYHENYVRAMQIIIQELLKQGSNDNKNITDDVFCIMKQLFQQADLTDETLSQGARQLIIESKESDDKKK